MSEEMNNELEEVIIVTATDDDGNEVNYQEVQRIDIDGKVFALLVEVPDSEDDADDDGDAIVARVDVEDGEEVYVAPTDEEFDAANAAFDELFSE